MKSRRSQRRASRFFQVAPSVEGESKTISRFPTQFASARVAVLNSTVSDDIKVERLRAMDREHGVSTLEMFTGDDVSSMLNLPEKILRSLREKVVELMGVKIVDLNEMQKLVDLRVDLVQQDLFQRPHDYQRIKARFNIAGEDIEAMAREIDSPQAREILAQSVRLGPWFETNMAGVMSGRLKAAVPLPDRGPGVLDKFTDTVDAALRGASGGFSFPSIPVRRPPQVIEGSAVHVDEAPASAPAGQSPVLDEQPPVRPLQKGVDPQWTPDLQQGSEEYVAEMAEHFQMIVRLNEERGARVRDEKIAAERKKAEEEAERQAKIEREALEQRKAEFMAKLPKADGLPLVDVLPARFMSDDVLKLVASIADSHVMAQRMMLDNASTKVRFLGEWKDRTGTDPDPIDEMNDRGSRMLADIAVRNGETAARLRGVVAMMVDLTDDATGDEIVARLVNDEERAFVARIAMMMQAGTEQKALIDGAEQRKAAQIRSDLERELSSRMSQTKEDAARVQSLEEEARVAAERIEQAEEAERAAKAAAEEAEQTAKAAVEEAAREKEALENKVRELEMRLAEAPQTARTAGVAEDEPEKGAIEWLESKFERFANRTGLDVFMVKRDTGIVVIVDIPDPIAGANEIIVRANSYTLIDALNKFVFSPIGNVDDVLDVTHAIVLCEGMLSPDVCARNLGLEKDKMEILTRHPVTIRSALKGEGIEVQ